MLKGSPAASTAEVKTESTESQEEAASTDKPEGGDEATTEAKEEGTAEAKEGEASEHSRENCEPTASAVAHLALSVENMESLRVRLADLGLEVAKDVQIPNPLGKDGQVVDHVSPD